MALEYQVTVVPRIPAESHPSSTDNTSPTFTPPAGDGWRIHDIEVGDYKYVVVWCRGDEINVNISRDSTQNLDAFGRLRTSDPYTLFDSAMHYSKRDEMWDELVEGSATSTHSSNEAAVIMTTGTASGDRVVRQSKVYCHYQPGKSHLILKCSRATWRYINCKWKIY